MPNSVAFVTRRCGKEKKVTRKKRNSTEDTNTSEESAELSHEKEVIHIAWLCVLSPFFNMM